MHGLLWSSFEEIAHIVYLFVALSVWMCVAGSNKVEGTMLGTNEILASKHDIAVLKVEQGHFETATLVLHNFFILC